MKNAELAEVARRVGAAKVLGDALTWEFVGLVLELARREIQRSNPESDRSPCEFDLYCETSCKWGSHGCIAKSHDSNVRCRICDRACGPRDICDICL